jgi:hypothetical protein
MERKYNMEIEGLMVEISYDFTEGDKGDYWTPPTGAVVKILGWRLLYEEEDRELNYDLDDSEWEDWMRDIDESVYNDSVWDIIEFEESLKY